MHIRPEIGAKMGIKKLAVFRDSELLIRQTMGSYTTKELGLLQYHRHVIKLAKEFEDIIFQHVLRNRNNFIDVLATLASLIHVSKSKRTLTINIEARKGPAYGNIIGEIDEAPQPQEAWYHNIKEYLRDQSLP